MCNAISRQLKGVMVAGNKFRTILFNQYAIWFKYLSPILFEDYYFFFVLTQLQNYSRWTQGLHVE